jgi:hypothetical protein
VGKQQVQGRQMQSRADMASIGSGGYANDRSSVRVSQAHCQPRCIAHRTERYR